MSFTEPNLPNLVVEIARLTLTEEISSTDK
jgi:hypothetical protein